MSRHPRDQEPQPVDVHRVTGVTPTCSISCVRRREAPAAAGCRGVTRGAYGATLPPRWSRAPGDQEKQHSKYTKTQMPAPFSRFVLR